MPTDCIYHVVTTTILYRLKFNIKKKMYPLAFLNKIVRKKCLAMVFPNSAFLQITNMSARKIHKGEWTQTAFFKIAALFVLNFVWFTNQIFI